MNRYVAAIGLRVKEARKLAGLTQAQLARAVGYSAANPISKLETGRTATVDIRLLERIAGATGVGVRFLTNSDEGGSQNELWSAFLASQHEQTRMLGEVLDRLKRLAELAEGRSASRKRSGRHRGTWS